MTTVQVYGLKRCSTCVKAMKWLKANDVEYTFIDYRDEPVAPAILSAWADSLGWNILINKASASWRSLTDEQKQASTKAQWLALVAAHPTLIKRPVLVRGDDVMVGFSEARYHEFLE